MGTTAPKDTAADPAVTDETGPTAAADDTAPDATASDDEPKTLEASDEPRVGIEHPADGTESPEISNDPPAGASMLPATVQGDLIILRGVGFESGTRYDVRIQRPDGSIDNTVAVADDAGALTTYATLKAGGKHVAWLEKLGERVAELKFKV